MASYCTPAYFLRAYDSRFTRENLSDSGVPVADADLADNENLLQLLAEASEMVAAACEVGKRYTADELDDIAALVDGGYLLKRLTADLAFGLIAARRGRAAADVARLAPRYGEALRQLELLRVGANLFPGVPDDDHPDAGLPSTANLNSPLNPNRVATIAATARRAFPFSCDRIPPPGHCGCP